MESFNVSIVSTSNPAVSLENPAIVNILDNDEAVIGFTQDVYEITEGSGKARVEVGLLSGKTAVPVTVSFTTNAGTAGEDDFDAKTMDITFEPGETEKWVEIDITDDNLLEPTESFGVSLVSSSVEAVKLGNPSSVNILDNDGKYVLIIE
ncbi:T9SS type B sorting domain-containing [Paramuricea clavata]|nr:T9SS type B sorting domain-containing [Paramuricea clavata]